MSDKLSHFDEAGQAHMVDVGAKAATRREAVAGAFVELNEAVLVSAWVGVCVGVVVWQGSGDVAANARGDCYAVLPSGLEQFAKGETVRVLLR